MNERFSIQHIPHGKWFGFEKVIQMTFTVRLLVFLSVIGTVWGVPDSIQATTDGGRQIKTLEIPLNSGKIPQTLRFPVYEQNGVQYFSAGLGKEERRLPFPPYPLKMIFVQGERAYLAGVDVEIFQKEGGKRLVFIPRDVVEGPWLFVNLPTGQYLIAATNSRGTTIKKAVNIPAQQTQKVHFRWP